MEYDLVGPNPLTGNIEVVGTGYVFVSYQHRLYITLQFKCRCAPQPISLRSWKP